MMLWLASHWLWLAGAAGIALCMAIPGTATFLFGTKLGRALFLTAALLCVGYWQRTDGYADGYRKAEGKREEWMRAAALQVASASLAESEANRKTERIRAESVNRIAGAYERGLTDAKKQGDAVAAGLRAGSLRLREQWRGCEAKRSAAEVAADPAIADPADELRAASAGRVVRIVAACQAERDALLNLAESDRAEVTP
jgi:hypothetical protein